jgi:hypothetical protein
MIRNYEAPSLNDFHSFVTSFTYVKICYRFMKPVANGTMRQLCYNHENDFFCDKLNK